MDTHIGTHDAIEPVLSLTELAAHLPVIAQTQYDLLSKGRGVRGLRVGRELRFPAVRGGCLACADGGVRRPATWSCGSAMTRGCFSQSAFSEG